MFTRHCAVALMLAASAALLSACGSTTDLADKGAPVETRNPVPVKPGAGGGTAGANAGGTPQSRVTTVDLAAKNGAAVSAPTQRVVYFDFDSFVIKDEYKPMLEGHAKALVASRSK